MKNLNKLLAMLCAVALIFTTVTVPVLAAGTSSGVITILDAELEDEDTAPALVQYYGSTPTTLDGPNGPSTATGGKWWKFTDNAAGVSAFEFTEPMTTGTYELSMSFYISATDGAKSPFYFALANKADTADNIEGQFGLMTPGAAATYGYVIQVDGNNPTGYTTPQNGTFMTYNMTLNRTAEKTTYEAKIVRMDDGRTAEYYGESNNTMAWDGFLLGGGTTGWVMILDYVKIEKIPNNLSVNKFTYSNYNGEVQEKVDTLTKTISLEFSRKVSDTNIADYVGLTRNGEPIDFDISLSDSNEKVFDITLNEELLVDDELVLTIDESLVAIDGSPMSEQYISTWKVADPFLILEAELETDCPTLVRYYGTGDTTASDPNKPSSGSRGYWYRFTDNASGVSAFEFEKPITTGRYEIDLSFYVPKSSAPAPFYLALANKEDTAANLDGQFGLITQGETVNGDYYVNVDGKGSETDFKPTPTNFYDYKMILDRTDEKTSYNVTITRIDDNRVATYSGESDNTMSWDGLLLGSGVAGRQIILDYVKIRELPNALSVSDVKFYNVDGDEQARLDALTKEVQIAFNWKMPGTDIENYVTVGKNGETMSTTMSLTGADNNMYAIKLNETLSPGDVLNISVAAELAAENGATQQGTPYSESWTVNNPFLILDKDFESDSIGTYSGFDINASTTSSNFAVEVREEDGGNRYLWVDTSSEGNGFKFSEPIPVDGGDYTVSFDFMIPSFTVTDSIVRYVCLNEWLETGSNSTTTAAYDQMGLLNILYDAGTDIANVNINGETLTDFNCTAGEWYTYTMQFNRLSGEFSLTVNERGNVENKLEHESTYVEGTWCNGWVSTKEYDSFKLFYGGVICVDNISVEKTAKAPTLTSASISFIKSDDVAETNVNKVSLITDRIGLNFGEKMTRKSLQEKMTLKKKETGADVAFDIDNSGGTTVILSGFTLEPETEYILTVASGAESAAGYKLSGDFECEFKTKGREFDVSLKEIQQGGVKKVNMNALKTGEAVAVVNAVNTTLAVEPYVLIVAYYDSDDKLLGLDTANGRFVSETEGEVQIAITLDKPSDTAKIDVMLWKSIGDALMSRMLEFR